MVSAVLMRRAGWTLNEISGAIHIEDTDGKVRGPNRQTVGRWMKRFGPLVADAIEAAEAVEVEAPPAEPEEPPPPAPAVEEPPEDAPLIELLDPAPEPPAPDSDPIFDRFEILKTLTGDSREGVYEVRDRWLPDGRLGGAPRRQSRSW